MKTLDIQTSRPRLDITSTRASLEITNKTRRFTSKRVAPQMNVERQAPTMKVNWSKVWAESGRRSPEQLKQYLNQMSRQNVDLAVQNFVNNGNYMLQLQNYIGKDVNPIAELSLERMKSELPEINVAMMPQSLPEVSWDPGYVRVEWTTGELQVEWDNEYAPDIRVTPHSVEIKLAGHSEVKISVKEDRVANESGNKVNKNA